MQNTQRFQLAVTLLVLSLGTVSAHAMPPDAITAYNNTVAISNCVAIDANGELKPNTKNTVCKVVTNAPGDKETRLMFDSTVNTGTLLSPKEEARRIEYRAEKTNGKISKLDYTVWIPENKKSDVYSYEVGANGEYTKARVSQNGQNFALVTREMCTPLKSSIEAFGNENVANCSAILAKMIAPLKVLQGELAKDGLKLGFPTPSRKTPSMLKMVPLNPERTGDAVGFIGGCAELFARENAKAEDATAAKPAPAADATKPSSAAQ
jgi:hypothetical protein